MFTRLIQLLGHREDSQRFQNLLEELEDNPEYHDYRDSRTYDLPGSGITISAHEYPGMSWQIDLVFLHFNTAATRCGEFEAFFGELPATVTAKDRRKQIYEKLENTGIRLLRTDLVQGREAPHGHRTDEWDEYQLSPELTMTVMSDAQNGRLGAISVSLTC